MASHESPQKPATPLSSISRPPEISGLTAALRAPSAASSNSSQDHMDPQSTHNAKSKFLGAISKWRSGGATRPRLHTTGQGISPFKTPERSSPLFADNKRPKSTLSQQQLTPSSGSLPHNLSTSSLPMTPSDQPPIVVPQFNSLEEVLRHKIGSIALKDFLLKEHSIENYRFWQAVEEFKNITDKYKMQKAARDIVANYVSDDAPIPININHDIREKTLRDAKFAHQKCFDESQKAVLVLMSDDSWSRFQRSKQFAALYQNPSSLQQTALVRSSTPADEALLFPERSSSTPLSPQQTKRGLVPSTSSASLNRQPTTATLDGNISQMPFQNSLADALTFTVTAGVLQVVDQFLAENDNFIVADRKAVTPSTRLKDLGIDTPHAVSSFLIKLEKWAGFPLSFFIDNSVVPSNIIVSRIQKVHPWLSHFAATDLSTISNAIANKQIDLLLFLQGPPHLKKVLKTHSTHSSHGVGIDSRPHIFRKQWFERHPFWQKYVFQASSQVLLTTRISLKRFPYLAHRVVRGFMTLPKTFFIETCMVVASQANFLFPQCSPSISCVSSSRLNSSGSLLWFSEFFSKKKPPHMSDSGFSIANLNILTNRIIIFPEKLCELTIKLRAHGRKSIDCRFFVSYPQKNSHHHSIQIASAEIVYCLLDQDPLQLAVDAIIPHSETSSLISHLGDTKLRNLRSAFEKNEKNSSRSSLTTSTVPSGTPKPGGGYIFASLQSLQFQKKNIGILFDSASKTTAINNYVQEVFSKESLKPKNSFYDFLCTYCPSEMDPTTIYTTFTHRFGIAYGPAYQAIQIAYRSSSRALSVLTLPAVLERVDSLSISSYVFHPVLMESALLTLLMATSYEPSQLYLDSKMISMGDLKYGRFMYACDPSSRALNRQLNKSSMTYCFAVINSIHSSCVVGTIYIIREQFDRDDSNPVVGSQCTYIVLNNVTIDIQTKMHPVSRQAIYPLAPSDFWKLHSYPYNFRSQSAKQFGGSTHVSVVYQLVPHKRMGQLPEALNQYWIILALGLVSPNLEFIFCEDLTQLQLTAGESSMDGSDHSASHRLSTISQKSQAKPLRFALNATAKSNILRKPSQLFPMITNITAQGRRFNHKSAQKESLHLASILEESVFSELSTLTTPQDADFSSYSHSVQPNLLHQISNNLASKHNNSLSVFAVPFKSYTIQDDIPGGFAPWAADPDFKWSYIMDWTRKTPIQRKWKTYLSNIDSMELIKMNESEALAATQAAAAAANVEKPAFSSSLKADIQKQSKKRKAGPIKLFHKKQKTQESKPASKTIAQRIHFIFQEKDIHALSAVVDEPINTFRFAFENSTSPMVLSFEDYDVLMQRIVASRILEMLALLYNFKIGKNRIFTLSHPREPGLERCIYFLCAIGVLIPLVSSDENNNSQNPASSSSSQSSMSGAQSNPNNTALTPSSSELSMQSTVSDSNSPSLQQISQFQVPVGLPEWVTTHIDTLNSSAIRIAPWLKPELDFLGNLQSTFSDNIDDTHLVNNMLHLDMWKAESNIFKFWDATLARSLQVIFQQHVPFARSHSIQRGVRILQIESHSPSINLTRRLLSVCTRSNAVDLYTYCNSSMLTCVEADQEFSSYSFFESKQLDMNFLPDKLKEKYDIVIFSPNFLHSHVLKLDKLGQFVTSQALILGYELLPCTDNSIISGKTLKFHGMSDFINLGLNLSINDDSIETRSHSLLPQPPYVVADLEFLFSTHSKFLHFNAVQHPSAPIGHGFSADPFSSITLIAAHFPISKHNPGIFDPHPSKSWSVFEKTKHMQQQFHQSVEEQGKIYPKLALASPRPSLTSLLSPRNSPRRKSSPRSHLPDKGTGSLKSSEEPSGNGPSSVLKSSAASSATSSYVERPRFFSQGAMKSSWSNINDSVSSKPWTDPKKISVYQSSVSSGIKRWASKQSKCLWILIGSVYSTSQASEENESKLHSISSSESSRPSRSHQVFSKKGLVQQMSKIAHASARLSAKSYNNILQSLATRFDNDNLHYCQISIGPPGQSLYIVDDNHIVLDYFQFTEQLSILLPLLEKSCKSLSAIVFGLSLSIGYFASLEGFSASLNKTHPQDVFFECGKSMITDPLTLCKDIFSCKLYVLTRGYQHVEEFDNIITTHPIRKSYSPQEFGQLVGQHWPFSSASRTICESNIRNEQPGLLLPQLSHSIAKTGLVHPLLLYPTTGFLRQITDRNSSVGLSTTEVPSPSGSVGSASTSSPISRGTLRIQYDDSVNVSISSSTLDCAALHSVREKSLNLHFNTLLVSLVRYWQFSEKKSNISTIDLSSPQLVNPILNLFSENDSAPNSTEVKKKSLFEKSSLSKKTKTTSSRAASSLSQPRWELYNEAFTGQVELDHVGPDLVIVSPNTPEYLVAEVATLYQYLLTLETPWVVSIRGPWVHQPQYQPLSKHSLAQTGFNGLAPIMRVDPSALQTPPCLFFNLNPGSLVSHINNSLDPMQRAALLLGKRQSFRPPAPQLSDTVFGVSPVLIEMLLKNGGGPDQSKFSVIERRNLVSIWKSLASLTTPVSPILGGYALPHQVVVRVVSLVHNSPIFFGQIISVGSSVVSTKLQSCPNVVAIGKFPGSSCPQHVVLDAKFCWPTPIASNAAIAWMSLKSYIIEQFFARLSNKRIFLIHPCHDCHPALARRYTMSSNTVYALCVENDTLVEARRQSSSIGWIIKQQFSSDECDVLIVLRSMSNSSLTKISSQLSQFKGMLITTSEMYQTLTFLQPNLSKCYVVLIPDIHSIVQDAPHLYAKILPSVISEMTTPTHCEVPDSYFYENPVPFASQQRINNTNNSMEKLSPLEVERKQESIVSLLKTFVKHASKYAQSNDFHASEEGDEFDGDVITSDAIQQGLDDKEDITLGNVNQENFLNKSLEEPSNKSDSLGAGRDKDSLTSLIQPPQPRGIGYTPTLPLSLGIGKPLQPAPTPNGLAVRRKLGSRRASIAVTAVSFRNMLRKRDKKSSTPALPRSKDDTHDGADVDIDALFGSSQKTDSSQDPSSNTADEDRKNPGSADRTFLNLFKSRTKSISSHTPVNPSPLQQQRKLSFNAESKSDAQSIRNRRESPRKVVRHNSHNSGSYQSLDDIDNPNLEISLVEVENDPNPSIKASDDAKNRHSEQRSSSFIKKPRGQYTNNRRSFSQSAGGMERLNSERSLPSNSVPSTLQHNSNSTPNLKDSSTNSVTPRLSVQNPPSFPDSPKSQSSSSNSAQPSKFSNFYPPSPSVAMKAQSQIEKQNERQAMPDFMVHFLDHLKDVVGESPLPKSKKSVSTWDSKVPVHTLTLTPLAVSVNHSLLAPSELVVSDQLSGGIWMIQQQHPESNADIPSDQTTSKSSFTQAVVKDNIETSGNKNSLPRQSNSFPDQKTVIYTGDSLSDFSFHVALDQAKKPCTKHIVFASSWFHPVIVRWAASKKNISCIDSNNKPLGIKQWPNLETSVVSSPMFEESGDLSNRSMATTVSVESGSAALSSSRWSTRSQASNDPEALSFGQILNEPDPLKSSSTKKVPRTQSFRRMMAKRSATPTNSSTKSDSTSYDSTNLAAQTSKTTSAGDTVLASAFFRKLKHLYRHSPYFSLICEQICNSLLEISKHAKIILYESPLVEIHQVDAMFVVLEKQRCSPLAHISHFLGSPLVPLFRLYENSANQDNETMSQFFKRILDTNYCGLESFSVRKARALIQHEKSEASVSSQKRSIFEIGGFGIESAKRQRDNAMDSLSNEKLISPVGSIDQIPLGSVSSTPAHLQQPGSKKSLNAPRDSVIISLLKKRVPPQWQVEFPRSGIQIQDSTRYQTQLVKSLYSIAEHLGFHEPTEKIAPNAYLYSQWLFWYGILEHIGFFSEKNSADITSEHKSIQSARKTTPSSSASSSRLQCTTGDEFAQALQKIHVGMHRYSHWASNWSKTAAEFETPSLEFITATPAHPVIGSGYIDSRTMFSLHISSSEHSPHPFVPQRFYSNPNGFDSSSNHRFNGRPLELFTVFASETGFRGIETQERVYSSHYANQIVQLRHSMGLPSCIMFTGSLISSPLDSTPHCPPATVPLHYNHVLKVWKQYQNQSVDSCSLHTFRTNWADLAGFSMLPFEKSIAQVSKRRAHPQLDSFFFPFVKQIHDVESEFEKQPTVSSNAFIQHAQILGISEKLVGGVASVQANNISVPSTRAVSISDRMLSMFPHIDSTLVESSSIFDSPQFDSVMKNASYHAGGINFQRDSLGEKKHFSDNSQRETTSGRFQLDPFQHSDDHNQSPELSHKTSGFAKEPSFGSFSKEPSFSSFSRSGEVASHHSHHDDDNDIFDPDEVSALSAVGPEPMNIKTPEIFTNDPSRQSFDSSNSPYQNISGTNEFNPTSGASFSSEAANSQQSSSKTKKTKVKKKSEKKNRGFKKFFHKKSLSGNHSLLVGEASQESRLSISSNKSVDSSSYQETDPIESLN